MIKPYEASQLHAFETAIRNSELGVNPTNDGTLIRVAVPQLTEERRRELVKQAKHKGEEARVSVRNIRRKAMEELHRIRKDGEAGEDEVGRAEKDLDKTTQQYVTQMSADLISWQNLATNIASSSGLFQATDPTPATNQTRYYRAYVPVQ